MNAICGHHMSQKSIGIFRQATFTRNVQDTPFSETASLTPATKRTITMWNNVAGQYVLYNTHIQHDVMKLANYTHITSPIRRLVDLLNQLLMFSSFSMVTHLSPHANEFLEKWLRQLEYINTSMRSIRKIQTDCDVLHRCIHQPHILQSTHTGILFDKLQKNDGGFVYMVFLEQLNLLTRLKTYTEYENYTSRDFQLYLFTDEHSLKQKIRVQVIG
jgi:exoribonuclease R